jgi:hypothetical protein
MKWLVALLMSYFVVRLLFFASSISHDVPPDEVTHFGLAMVFSRVLLLPENSPDTFQHGLVTNIPWLYSWIMGKLLALNYFGITDLLFLRLLNIPLALGTVLYSWSTLRLLTDDRLTQLVLVVVMTNTLMFSFLSASISYDNLANLLSAMAVYYLLAFFKERSGHLLALSLISQLAGCLTKISLLPLSLTLILLLVVHERRELRRLPSTAKSYFRESGRRGIALSLAVCAGLLLNLHLYGGNYLHYGKVNPAMADILPMESTMQYRLAARETIFVAFKENRISLPEAMEMTSHIRHGGDRAGTAYLLQNLANRRQVGEELMGPIAYIIPWAQRIMATVYGILGHISMFNEGVTLWPVAALIACAGLSILLRWQPGDASGSPNYLAVIFSSYALFVMYAFNYRIYLYFESFQIALQGRYLFPVLGPFYVLFSYYLMRLFKRRGARLAAALTTTIVFAVSDFPFFLSHATPAWFTVLPRFLFPH